MKKANRKKARKSQSNRLSSFATMARRSAEKYEMAAADEKEFGWSTKMYVEKTMAAQKGRPSVFKRLGRPGIFELCEAFYSEKLASALLRVGSEHDVQEQSEFGNRAALFVREHDCFKDFNMLPYTSLHDSIICQWIAKPGSLSVLFVGYFSNSGSAAEDYLEVRFVNPCVRVVSPKGTASLSAAAKNGAFSRGGEGNGDFFESDQQSKAAVFAKVSGLGLSFDDIGYVFSDERSAKSEGSAQEWRIMFGRSGGMEMSIGFDSLELTHGRIPILEKRKARKMASELDAMLPRPDDGVAKNKPRI